MCDMDIEKLAQDTIHDVLERIKSEPSILLDMPSMTSHDFDIVIPGVGIDNAWRIIQEHYDLRPSDLQKVKNLCEEMKGESNHEQGSGESTERGVDN